MFETHSDLHEQRTEAEKYYGKYPGRVVNNEPPDGADHRGELLVKVPGILEEMPDGEGLQPIQVVAKPCFLPGVFFVPEAGAQVWVEFVAGDLGCPVWTGVWYPSRGSPQTVEGHSPTEYQKVIRTASGHVIQLDDSEGEEKVVIQHTSGAVIEMKEDRTVAIRCDALTITADVTVDGTLHITGNTEIDADLTVGAGPKTTISGNEIKGG
jgi:hypothetical protein